MSRRYVPPAMAALTCCCCGMRYYLYTAIAAYVDTGYCVSCENEIRWLEQYYGTDPQEVRP